METKIKKITGSSVSLPSYLLNLPTSFDTSQPNNIWMEEMTTEDLKVDSEIAMAQWLDLFNLIASVAYVQVLPTPKDKYLQDLVFVANIGIVLSHIKDREVVVISNFTSPPRFGETQVGVDYFTLAGYEVHVCPYKFEGEAELKHIRDNIYIGGYGMRTQKEAYDWMEEKFDMKIIKVKTTNPKLYHFDCHLFPITTQDVLLATKEIDIKDVKAIEKVANVIHVPSKYAEFGVTNNVRLHNLILNASDIYDMSYEEDGEYFIAERDKNLFLEDICSGFAMEPSFISLSEYVKGGAMCSCCVMHLNRISYSVELL